MSTRKSFIPPEKTLILCVMVGLPARGKTYIGQKVERYLQWLSVPCKIFNVGNYRREIAGAQQPAEFFSEDNEEAKKLRQKAAESALDDLLKWLLDQDPESCTKVAIYDATNSTLERRNFIRKKCMAVQNVQVMFIESICDNPQLIKQNIKQVKIGSPDYFNLPPDKASEDFLNRIKHYEEHYQTLGQSIDEKNASYIQLFNVNEKFIIHCIHGYLQSRVVYYLMNLHIKQRSILMCRHGESQFNVLGKIGGDASLSPRGLMFARALPGLLHRLYPPGQDLNTPESSIINSPVDLSLSNASQLSDDLKNPILRKMTLWTSTLKRTLETGQYIESIVGGGVRRWKALDELDAGVCDGMTYEEIEQQYPTDFQERDHDKFHYRYKGGESYKDLVMRLEPIIMELERQEHIFIIAHQAVLRAIYAYFLNLPHAQLPYVHIPLHQVMQLTPKPYGCDVRMIPLGIEAVDTHRLPKAGSSNQFGGKAKRGSYGDKGFEVGEERQWLEQHPEVKENIKEL